MAKTSLRTHSTAVARLAGVSWASLLWRNQRCHLKSIVAVHTCVFIYTNYTI